VRERPTNPQDPRYWTPERRDAARAWWTIERRAREALRRLDKPQGCYDRSWWTAERRAAHAERLRQARAGDGELDDLLRQADAAVARLRKLGGL
jgi:hypothetical protein